MNAQTRDLTEESLMEGILPEALAALKQPMGEAEGQINGASRKPDRPSPYPGLQGKGGKILLDPVESRDHKIGGLPDEPQPQRTQSLSEPYAGTEVLTLASPSLARSPGYLSVEVIFAGPGAGGHGWKGWGWGVVIRELKLSIGLLVLKMEIAVLSMWRCCEDEE